MFEIVTLVTIPFVGTDEFSMFADVDTAPEAAAAALLRWNSLRPIHIVSVEKI